MACPSVRVYKLNFNMNPIIAVVSDVVYQAAIAAVLAISLAYINARIGKVAKVANLTHDLVNSASLLQLRLYSTATARVAALTKDPADIAAASDVAKLLVEREAQAEQAKLNAK